MGYQALLFCPDEKTARTVMQVLSELDFTVTPCTEPFAAVKKLMAEHFDAVVVDCENEQNATLLFKSARNAPNNQSALAVAVVEGQVGVAKAFRIGANLVLTKPINVEQAKGTLRVARGLLRKNESAKPANMAPSPTGKAIPATPSPKPTLVTSNPIATRPTPPVVRSEVPPAKPAPQPSFAASASSLSGPARNEQEDSVEPSSSIPAPALTPIPSPTIIAAKTQPALTKPPVQPKPEQTFGRSEPSGAVTAPGSTTASTGTASAAAPAREPKAGAFAVENFTVPSAQETPAEKTASAEVASAIDESQLPPPALTFGGNVEPEIEVGEPAPKSAGSKKGLLAVAAVVLLAAAGYAVWSNLATLTALVKNPAALWTHSATPAISQPSPVPPPVASPAPVPVATAPDATNSNGIIKPSGLTNGSSPATEISSPATEKPQNAGNAAPVSAKPVATVASANKVGTPPAGGQTTVTRKDLSQQAARPVLQIPQSAKSEPVASDTSMPSIPVIASTDNNGALPNLMNGGSSAPAPVLQAMNISQGVSQGLIIKKSSPAYPANALRLRIEGPVQLLATVTKTGDISTVKVLSGDASLARAAVEAVKQWKYKPYLLDGTPVEIQTQITVNFKLPR